MVIHVIRAGTDNPETSLAAKLYFTLKFSPSRHTILSSKFLSAVTECVSQRPTEIEQLRYHCECIDPLGDTRDARWISLISITMRHAVLIRRIM